MSLHDISGQIQAFLSAVDGAGVVHPYQRWADTWSKYLDHFKSDGRINGWMFCREKTAQRQRTAGELERAHVFVLRKLYGLKDDAGSELVFQQHLEDATAAFSGEAADTLNGTCETISPDWGPMSGAAGLQIDIAETRMFGGVLCHYGECRLCALDTVAV